MLSAASRAKGNYQQDLIRASFNLSARLGTLDLREAPNFLSALPFLLTTQLNFANLPTS